MLRRRSKWELYRGKRKGSRGFQSNLLSQYYRLFCKIPSQLRQPALTTTSPSIEYCMGGFNPVLSISSNGCYDYYRGKRCCKVPPHKCALTQLIQTTSINNNSNSQPVSTTSQLDYDYNLLDVGLQRFAGRYVPLVALVFRVLRRLSSFSRSL